MAPFSHCHFCGTAFSSEDISPSRRDCRSCRSTTWHNPTPISVTLQPVYRMVPDGRYPRQEHGLLVGRRTIEPKKGLFGLPGGFVDLGDRGYEQAARRELSEEIKFLHSPSWPLDQQSPNLRFSLPGDPGQLIAFCEAACAIPEFWLESFSPSSECDAVKVVWQPEELCFPSHTEAVRLWFLSNRTPEPLSLTEAAKRFYAERQKVQESCQHEWVDAPEYYDHHKREEFSRCVLCELVR